MAATEGSSFSAIQPDLEEFLSALNGFLSKQTSPTDPGNIRFLEIFFRTVKSDKGHLLKITETGTLQSLVSYGMGPRFDEEFNKANAESSVEPSPLDVAFRDKEALAIVDMAKDPDVPAWFRALMKKHNFISLVAVPLMGANKPIGILCAYYNDVCLFDRATLGHLMMIGKMVGGATEKSLAADRVESHGEKEKVADHFLKILLSKNFSKIQVYSLMAKIFSECVAVSGLISGPLTKTSEGLTLTIAAGVSLPSSALSSQIVLPSFLATRFLAGTGLNESASRSRQEWGQMESLIGVPLAVEMSKPLSWQNKAEGAVIVWRAGGQKFEEEDDLLLGRLAGIGSLALHVP